MTNSQFKNIFEQFSKKPFIGHNPDENVIRFCQYEIGAENFLPDFSRYSLDLNSFCLCVSHLEISIDSTTADQNRRVYQSNILIVKTAEVNNYDDEAACINDAQRRAEWLWADLKHHQMCVEIPDQKRKGVFLGKGLKLSGNFRINDLIGLTNNACGIEMQLSFYEDITHQYIRPLYPEWNL